MAYPLVYDVTVVVKRVLWNLEIRTLQNINSSLDILTIPVTILFLSNTLLFHKLPITR